MRTIPAACIDRWCCGGPPQKAAAAGALPEEREDDDAEGDAASAGASYDYLLSMPIHSLTHEKAGPRPSACAIATHCSVSCTQYLSVM